MGIAWITVGLLCLACVVSSSLVFDCDDRSNDEVRLITITEVDPIDTVLMTFNNSVTDLRWAVSIQETNQNYLSLFFKSTSTEDAPQTHMLTLAKILDLELLQLELTQTKTGLFEAINGFSLMLDLTTTCKNTAGRSQDWRFTLKVEPVNEFIPQFMGAPFQISVPESSEVGTDIFNIGVHASDQDAGMNNLTFTIARYVITQFDGSQYVEMSQEENGMIQLKQPLDYEKFLKGGRTFMFVNVTVTDDGGFTSATSVNVSVTDDNDQSVQFIYPDCLTPCEEANYTAVTNESYIGPLTVEPVQIMVKDLDAINEPVIYSLESGNAFFRIDSTTGRLYKTSPLINDTYDTTVYLNVKARETSRSDHSVDTTVTVLIQDRLIKATTTAVPLQQRSDLECTADEISVFLPANLFSSNRNMTWRDETCSLQNNGTHYVGTISLAECGSTVEIGNDTVAFSNEILVLKADDNDLIANSEITHGEDFDSVIPVKCVYPRFSSISNSYVPVKQNVRFVEEKFGALDISMEQFTDAGFESAVGGDEYPRKIPLNDDVFIRIGSNFERSDLRVETDQCIATSKPSPADDKWLPLIESGCPKNGVRLLSSANSSDVRFTFKAFDFRHDSSGFIYLHCQVSICDRTDESCRMDCSTRTRRSADVNRKSHLVSAGPFFVHDEDKPNQDTGVSVPTVFAVAALVVAIAASVLAVIGWTRKIKT